MKIQFICLKCDTILMVKDIKDKMELDDGYCPTCEEWNPMIYFKVIEDD